jgi:benzoylformate decarboxylase
MNNNALDTTYGRDTFLSLLVDEGVTHLFGNPGTTELPIMHALRDHTSLTYVLGLQESVVIAMADGFCRASGKLAACNVHVAPGLGNALGAIYNANLSGSPLIITAGQQEQGHGLMEPLLYGPLVDMARPLVKWATEITRIEDVPRILRRAAKVAMASPTGPVFLSLPGDILNRSATIDLGHRTRVDALTLPSDASLHRLSKRILAAEKPVLLVGTEIVTSDALHEAAELADVLGAPVYQQTVPHGAHFFSEHPAFMGALTRIQRQVRSTLSPYDLMVCIGADVLQMSVWSETDPLPPELHIVQIGLRDWEMGKNYPSEIALRSDVKETLQKLIPQLKQMRGSEKARTSVRALEQFSQNNWSTNRMQRQQDLGARSDETSIDPDWLMMQIADSIPADTIIVDEGLTTSKNLLQFLPHRDRYSYFGMVSGGIGWGIAAAVGVQLAQPDRPVVAISGDGSAMYSPQALWTAAHLKLPILFLIFNNQGYRILKERLLAFHGNDQYIGMNLREPSIDFTGLATSFGMRAEKITDTVQFESTFKDAVTSDTPCLLEIMLQPGP